MYELRLKCFMISDITFQVVQSSIENRKLTNNTFIQCLLMCLR